MQKFFICFLILLFTNSVLAGDHSDSDKNIQDRARDLLRNIFNDNSKHVTKNMDVELFDIQDGQTPRATVVSCSDSRVQSSTIDDTPVNDLFYIRNIGNQIESAKGSVRYGVQYLHTPVLLIIGHVECGAVKAAIGDYKKKPQDLRKELYT
jgi:carbonic anhydrase